MIRPFLAICLIAFATVTAPLARAEVVIQQLTSPNGTDFWLVEEPSIPIVAVEMEFRGGSRLDPVEQVGVSRFAMGLMDEGAAEMDAVAFSNRADEVSARMGFSAGSDSASVSARFLVETLDESIDLLATAMHQPRFDPEPVERLRQQILSGISRSETDPNAIAGRAWFSLAFPDHPYGRPSRGTRETVGAITVEDLSAAHQRLLTRSAATIGIVGAINAEQAGALVDRLLAGLPEGAPAEAEWINVIPPAGVEVIEQNVPQSVAIFGHRGIPRTDPDFIAAFVVNHILAGGSFTSRLTEEVREKRGLAYSVAASIQPYDMASVYVGSVQTENARIAESLDVIRAEWARMAAEGPSAEDLAKAKTYLTGSFPLRFDSNAKIAGYLVFMQVEDLGADYINRRNGLVEAITVEDTKRVAARILDADALSIVVVGKPEGL